MATTLIGWNDSPGTLQNIADRRRTFALPSQQGHSLAPMAYAKSLAVFDKGFHFFLDVGEGAGYQGFEAPPLVFQRGEAFLWQRVDQVADQRPHTPHDLDAGCAVCANFVEGQGQEVLPRGMRNCQPQVAVRVPEGANLEPPVTQAQKLILYVVECLNRGGRIIHRRR